MAKIDNPSRKTQTSVYTRKYQLHPSATHPPLPHTIVEALPSQPASLRSAGTPHKQTGHKTTEMTPSSQECGHRSDLRVLLGDSPSRFAPTLHTLVAKLLQKEPSKRLKIGQILELPIIQRRLRALCEGVADSSVPPSYIQSLVQVCNRVVWPAVLGLQKAKVSGLGHDPRVLLNNSASPGGGV